MKSINSRLNLVKTIGHTWKLRGITHKTISLHEGDKLSHPGEKITMLTHEYLNHVGEWIRPVNQFYSVQNIKNMIKDGKIEVVA